MRETLTTLQTCFACIDNMPMMEFLGVIGIMVVAMAVFFRWVERGK